MARMDVQEHNRLAAAGYRWLVTLHHGEPVSHQRLDTDADLMRDRLRARWTSVDCEYWEHPEGGPIRIYLALAPDIWMSVEALEAEVAILWEEVARGGKAFVQTLEEALGPEEASRVAAIYAGHGALAHTMGTVDDFLRDRHAEVNEEERRERLRWQRLAERARH